MRMYLFFIFMLLVIFSYAATINIPQDQATIQAGIDVAVEGDTVLVQPGIYQENIDFSGKNIRLTSLYSATQDTTNISGTVIDGNQAGNVVLINSGESDAILSGFTLTNGNSAEGGAGIFIENSTTSLENLIISNNFSNWPGAGIYCNESNVTLTESRITGNVTVSNGGGINIRESTFSIDNCLLTDNQADGYGGGAIYVSQSYVTVNNSVFRDNHANGNGGAILSDTWYLVEITDTEFYCNTATSHGGALMSYACDLVLNRVTLHHNTANEGGALYNFYSRIEILNCTIADNQAIESASGIGMESGSYIVLLNTIVYDNPGISWSHENGFIQAAYCDIEDYEQFTFIEPLENVIDEDPLFMDHPESNYYLRQDSPCHDSGIVQYHFIGYDYEVTLAVDEFMGIMPDMGAYEYYEVNENDDNYIVSPSNGLCCYPNPFNPETNLLFRIDEPQSIDLKIYNLKGQLINTLYSGILPAGEHQFTWDGNNRQNRMVSSGIYLAVMSTGNQNSVTRLVLIK
ncbi:MAG: T9SS type A sorting domain-containing protein [Candidatus Cloacimonetes bacterium]|nr:T9SS type A sorting domain-containing protein [Candidatus Cloacimonadota bacterium]